MPNAYPDGDFSTPFLVKNVVNYPFPWPSNSNVSEFDLEFVVAAANFADAALGSNTNYAPNAYLVEKGPVEKIAPGFLRYRRVYCQLPINWQETQQVAYTYPGLSGPVAANNNTFNPYYARASLSLYRIATVFHNYSQGATAPTLDNVFQVTDDGNVCDYIGIGNPSLGGPHFTDPASEPSTYVVSSDSKLLRGLIWEKVTLTVPQPVI